MCRRRMPAIHPAIGIDSLPATNHQPEFTAHCVTAAADQAIFDGALAMAWTIVDHGVGPGDAGAFTSAVNNRTGP